MKYRKKPIIVDAWRWVGDLDAIPEWLEGRFQRGDSKYYLLIPTLEGTMRAELGDYIIRGISSEIYPCKPDIFEKTYEAVT